MAASIDSRALRIGRFLFGMLTLLAFARQAAIHRAHDFSMTNLFSYFTVISNLLAGGVLLGGALPAKTRAPGRPQEIVRAIAVIDMALVGIVFSVLLRDADVGLMAPWVNVVHHYVMPLVLVVDWILVPPAVRLGGRDLLICLVFPVTYLVYVLVRGSITGWYPYPFLNPALVGNVAGYVVGIAAAFIIVGWGLVAIGNRRRVR